MRLVHCFTLVLAAPLLIAGCRTASVPLFPRITGEWWTVARNPDLGELNGPPKNEPHARQQPVDFAVWQAAGGTWQLWSCIRGTDCGGKTRLLYGWEGQELTSPDWQPMGIRMQADPSCGETSGGLQAPFVFKHDGEYWMFYGDWVNICVARSNNGKEFDRWLMPDGRAGMFNEGEPSNARDPIVLRVGEQWHCYYTAHPGRTGAVYCRTSCDLRKWSDSTIVARGGSAGTGPSSAECPYVVSCRGYYYLFRTQKYADPPTTRVYRSQDPMDFGADNDDKLIGVLEVAAPEIVRYSGQWYIAALLPDIQGIRIARLEWVPDTGKEEPTESETGVAMNPTPFVAE